MVKRGEWRPICLHVSASVRAKLFDAAADRRKAEPDSAVLYHAGAIVDEALREHFNMSG